MHLLSSDCPLPPAPLLGLTSPCSVLPPSSPREFQASIRGLVQGPLPPPAALPARALGSLQTPTQCPWPFLSLDGPGPPGQEPVTLARCLRSPAPFSESGEGGAGAPSPTGSTLQGKWWKRCPVTRDLLPKAEACLFPKAGDVETEPAPIRRFTREGWAEGLWAHPLPATWLPPSCPALPMDLQGAPDLHPAWMGSLCPAPWLWQGEGPGRARGLAGGARGWGGWGWGWMMRGWMRAGPPVSRLVPH